MIIDKTGDLFSSQLNCLVNTVNCVGVMGAGIAKQFKVKYPKYFEDYKQKCYRREINVGSVDIYNDTNLNDFGELFIISFPTKKHWKNPSMYQWIEEGLKDFVIKINKISGHINGVAMPYLGCNNGKLNETIVRQYIESIANQINIDIELWKLR